MVMVTATALALGSLVVAAGSASYGIYAGERARSAAQRANNQARQDAQTEQQRQQAQYEADQNRQQVLYDKQVADQKAADDAMRAQQDASLAQVKSEIPGMTDKLGSDLLNQQQAAYTRMTPQMEARLNALGLLQSGALPEAQAKQMGILESQRQAALTQFRTNADTQLNIQQPLANSAASVQRQQDALRNNLQTSQNNLAQTFANQNAYDQNQAATGQYLAGLSAANNTAAQSSANSYMNFGGQIGSGLISSYYKQPASTSGSGNVSLDAYKSVMTPGYTTPSPLNYYGYNWKPQ